MLAALCCAVATVTAPLRAQVPQPPDPQAPAPEPARTIQDPGARVATSLGPDVVVDAAVEALQGKPVRAIQVGKAGRSGTQPSLWEAAATESFVRSLETRVGQPFEARKVSADCSTLWKERRIVAQAYARAVDGEVLVTFLVELEVEVYDGVEFVGNENLDQKAIDGLLGLTPDRQVTRTEAEAMRKVLKARYGRDGYTTCSITLQEQPALEPLPGETEPVGANGPRRRLKFLIDEGPKVTIGTLTFVGNHAFAADALFGLLGPDTYMIKDSRMASTPARGIINGAAFSREVLEEDLDRLRSFYRGRGFLDATVDLGEVLFRPDRKTADLTFVIVEGPRYRIRSIKVAHVTESRQALGAPPLHPIEEIEKELKVVPGEYYDHDHLQRDVQAILDYYGKRGHPPWNFPKNVAQSCRVFDPLEIYGADATVDIVYQVSEGVPKRLRDLVIRGNRFTRDAVIRRRVRVLPGDRIDMVEVKRGLRSLEQTRYFQDAQTQRGPRLQLEPVPNQPDLVDIGLDVQDGSTGELRWGVGISTGQGFAANVTFNKRNFDLWNPPSSLNPITAIGEILDNEAFHGGGQTLQLFLAPGNRVSQYQATWVEPDVFGMHFDTYELRVSGRRIIRPLPDGYTSDTLGASVGLSRYFTQNFSLGLSVREDGVKVRNLAADATSLAYAAEGHTELRGVSLSAHLREVDDFVRPTEGYDFTLTGEVVGGPFGGGADFTKLTHRADWYAPVTENERGHRTVLHLAQFFGVANAFGDSDSVFLTERFYMGAYNLRGFGFRRAGPKQFGRPLGGEAQWTGTIEMSFPLVATRVEGGVRDQELLRWVLFNDFGLLGTDINDSTFRQLRAASGIGLRIEIPGLNIPVAIDVGWPWRYQETDDRDQVYFSIGNR